jgi:hypothetical protein
VSIKGYDQLAMSLSLSYVLCALTQPAAAAVLRLRCLTLPERPNHCFCAYGMNNHEAWVAAKSAVVG